MRKEEKYRLLTAQVKSLIEGETDSVSVMANVSAAVHEAMGFFWTGFYIVHGDELRLGPFQGSVACMHIPFGRGVCGTAWKEAKTIVVPDVEEFPGISPAVVSPVPRLSSLSLTPRMKWWQSSISTVATSILSMKSTSTGWRMS